MTQDNLKRLLVLFRSKKNNKAVLDIINKYPHLEEKPKPVEEEPQEEPKKKSRKK